MTYPIGAAPPARKIIILGLPRLDRPAGHRLLKLSIRFLQALDYRFVTISEALLGASERCVCLIAEGLPPTAPLLSGLPVTVFAAVSELSDDGWQRLAAARRAGWEIGCSGLASVNLTELSSVEQRTAIVKARRLMLDRLSVEPRVFCYPFGAYDATTVSILRDAGFDAAITALPGINGSSISDPYHLRRLSLARHPLRGMTSLVKHALGPAPMEANPLVPNAAPRLRVRVRSGVVL